MSETAPAKHIYINGKSTATPHMVMSVSSVETNLSPEDYTRFLVNDPRINTILVSAYDIFWSPDRSVFYGILESAINNGVKVILDSGQYERSRYHDCNWSREYFIGVAKDTPFDWCFCYDNHEPEDNAAAIAEDVIDRVTKDEIEIARKGKVQPIVHSPINKEYLLPDTCKIIAKELRPEVVAIAERYLGFGILDRARTVRRIRAALDALDFYQPIHVLGTGNPISMFILAAAGADIFDGLEWCRTSVDHQTGRLHHTQQYDLFNWQSDYWDEENDYALKFLSHNLDFYSEWNRAIPYEFMIDNHWSWIVEKGYLDELTVEDIQHNISIEKD